MESQNPSLMSHVGASTPSSMQVQNSVAAVTSLGAHTGTSVAGSHPFCTAKSSGHLKYHSITSHAGGVEGDESTHRPRKGAGWAFQSQLRSTWQGKKVFPRSPGMLSSMLVPSQQEPTIPPGFVTDLLPFHGIPLSGYPQKASGLGGSAVVAVSVTDVATLSPQ